MDEAKADGKSELPVWVSESRQLRTLLNDAEKSMHKGRADSNSSQRKFSSLMKADPKEAERLDFRYPTFVSFIKIYSPLFQLLSQGFAIHIKIWKGTLHQLDIYFL